MRLLVRIKWDRPVDKFAVSSESLAHEIEGAIIPNHDFRNQIDDFESGFTA